MLINDLETYGELATAEFKPSRMFLAPWVHDQTLSLLVGPRGSGKTWIGMAIAQAIASGSKLGPWETVNKTKVLYLEGEMPRKVLSTRFIQIDESAEHQMVGGAVSIRSCDHYEKKALPNIANTEDQEHYRNLFFMFDVIIIDNLLNIARPIDSRDHELAIWQRTASFLKEQRSKGKAIILLHHTGKSGTQMGTIVKENDVDTFLMVTPETGRKTKGFGAEIRFDKARYLEYPHNKTLWIDYSAALSDCKYVWSVYPVEERRIRQVVELKGRGMSERDISEAMALPLFTIRELIREASYAI